MRFFLAEEGGRSSEINGKFYGCPMLVDNEGFDCRLMLDGQSLKLGSTYEIAVKFLNKDLALPKLFSGKEFFYGREKKIARGSIVKIF